ncbi:MAG TPA: phytoene/squalene synthase family protein [Ktedonobacteraceae bacterium]|nr:phytoene/squalene synthase family protein [Ktedonobacteraceae bacterium]
MFREKIKGTTRPPVSMPDLPVATPQADEELLATHGKTFHFATRFFPPELRSSVVTLYAFFRTLDDLVDEPAAGKQPADVRLELAAWQAWFTQNRAFAAPRQQLGSQLDALLTVHPIPATIFLDFLDGLASDLEPREVHSFAELYRYCYQVAGTVGLAMTYLLGAHSPLALLAAQNLGIAMQLTNILRDVGSDLAAGRLYIPLDDLKQFGSSRTHLFQLYHDHRGPDKRFCNLMRYQIARAQRYYARGMHGIWLLPTNCRLPVLIAGRLYQRILTVIEHQEYDVLRARAATTLLEKLHEAAIAFSLARLWSQGEASFAPEMEVFLERSSAHTIVDSYSNASGPTRFTAHDLQFWRETSPSYLHADDRT